MSKREKVPPVYIEKVSQALNGKSTAGVEWGKKKPGVERGSARVNPRPQHRMVHRCEMDGAPGVLSGGAITCGEQRRYLRF